MKKIVTVNTKVSQISGISMVKWALSSLPPKNNLKAKEKNEWTNKNHQWQLCIAIFIGIKRQVEFLDFIPTSPPKKITQRSYLQGCVVAVGKKKKKLYIVKKQQNWTFSQALPYHRIFLLTAIPRNFNSYNDKWLKKERETSVTSIKIIRKNSGKSSKIY